jgi:hypothetical protein
MATIRNGLVSMGYNIPSVNYNVSHFGNFTIYSDTGGTQFIIPPAQGVASLATRTSLQGQVTFLQSELVRIINRQNVVDGEIAQATSEYNTAVSYYNSLQPELTLYKDILYPLALNDLQQAEIFRNQFQPGTNERDAANIYYQQTEQWFLTTQARRDELINLSGQAANDMNTKQNNIIVKQQELQSLKDEYNQVNQTMISTQTAYNNSQGVTVGLGIFIGKYFRY